MKSRLYSLISALTITLIFSIPLAQNSAHSIQAEDCTQYCTIQKNFVAYRKNWYIKDVSFDTQNHPIILYQNLNQKIQPKYKLVQVINGVSQKLAKFTTSDTNDQYSNVLVDNADNVFVSHFDTRQNAGNVKVFIMKTDGSKKEVEIPNSANMWVTKLYRSEGSSIYLPLISQTNNTLQYVAQVNANGEVSSHTIDFAENDDPNIYNFALNKNGNLYAIINDHVSNKDVIIREYTQDQNGNFTNMINHPVTSLNSQSISELVVNDSGKKVSFYIGNKSVVATYQLDEDVLIKTLVPTETKIEDVAITNLVALKYAEDQLFASVYYSNDTDTEMRVFTVDNGWQSVYAKRNQSLYMYFDNAENLILKQVKSLPSSNSLKFALTKIYK